MRPGQSTTGNQGEVVMAARDWLASVGALILSLALAGPASADDCQLRMGPYASQSNRQGVSASRRPASGMRATWSRRSPTAATFSTYCLCADRIESVQRALPG